MRFPVEAKRKEIMRNKVVLILALYLAVFASCVYSYANQEIEKDVDSLVDRISAIKKENPHEYYQKSMNVFMSYDEQRRNRMAKEILRKSANKSFQPDSKLNRDIFGMAIRVLEKSGSLYGQRENAQLLYRIFLSNPDFTGSGFYYDLYEMNKPKDIHIDELRRELISGRARILELAIHWDLDCFQDDIEEILKNPNSKWGVEEKLVIGGKRTQPKTIQIYPSVAFNTHSKCRELGKNNHVPAQYVYVKDLAKAYLAWCGDQEELSALQNAYAEAIPAKADRDVKDRDKNYYYALLYLIGYPPGPCPFIPLQQ